MVRRFRAATIRAVTPDLPVLTTQLADFCAGSCSPHSDSGTIDSESDPGDAHVSRRSSRQFVRTHRTTRHVRSKNHVTCVRHSAALGAPSRERSVTGGILPATPSRSANHGIRRRPARTGALPALGEQEHIIYLPFENLRDVFEKQDSSIVLPYAQFLDMWNRLKQATPATEPLPVHGVISRAEYVGHGPGRTSALGCRTGYRSADRGLGPHSRDVRGCGHWLGAVSRRYGAGARSRRRTIRVVGERAGQTPGQAGARDRGAGVDRRTQYHCAMPAGRRQQLGAENSRKGSRRTSHASSRSGVAR